MPAVLAGLAALWVGGKGVGDGPHRSQSVPVGVPPATPKVMPHAPTENLPYWLRLKRNAMPELMFVVANEVDTFGWLICWS